jgi:membrane-associated phospholipid phosphatase
MARAELVAIVLKTLGKRSVNRTRPTALLEDGTYGMEPGTSSAHALQSFPSGHTAGAVAVARAFAHVFPERAPSALTAALIVGLLQLPRKAHFASDVAAGVLVGFLAERLSRPWAPAAREQRGAGGIPV